MSSWGYAGHEPYREEELPAEPWFREVGRTIVETTEETLTEVRTIASRLGERFPLPKLTYVFAFAAL